MINTQYNITYRKKDGSIQYIISYKDNNGKWRQKSKQGYKKSADAKRAAQAAISDLESSIEASAKLDKNYKETTFKEYRDLYINHIKICREGNTIDSFSNAFDKFKELNDMKLNEIDSANIQKCIDSMELQGLKYSTIKTYLAKIHTAFNYAIKPLKIIIENPIKDLDIITSKENTNKRALTQSELEDLLSKIKNKKYRMISLIAGKCGLRIGEILGLTWDRIDFKNRIIKIDRQWKLLKDGTCGFGELKSKNSYREIPFSYNVKKESEEYKKLYPINIDNRLFSLKSRKIISSTLTYIYKKAGYDISVHELRHTYATTLIANGVDFKTVAYLMGHDVKQTIDTYSHITEDMLKNVTEKIDKIF